MTKTPIKDITGSIDTQILGIEEFKKLSADVLKKAEELEKAVQRLNDAKLEVKQKIN
ncbi:hypothetical protein VMHJH2_07200 [Streptococcus uberis]|uniref:hypothetical protein n=1 Tax=Streptococcus uberis TaxID=1349 RepID=UPI00214F950F|nr:hypothetical protein [Streptococcus uberis]MCR4258301.1 hypothetical protein [Streptococcus uberis]